jgi:hypothetical protein
MPGPSRSHPYGYRTTVTGWVTAPELTQWHDDCKLLVSTLEPGFGQLVDLRRARALPPDSVPLLADFMRYLREKGLLRSAVVVDSAITKMQVSRLAKETGLDAFERYSAPPTSRTGSNRRLRGSKRPRTQAYSSVGPLWMRVRGLQGSGFAIAYGRPLTRPLPSKNLAPAREWPGSGKAASISADADGASPGTE